MAMTGREQKDQSQAERNSVDITVEMFDGADCVVIEEPFGEGIVAVSPADSTSGTVWVGMGLITSPDEVRESKYPAFVRGPEHMEPWQA